MTRFRTAFLTSTLAPLVIASRLPTKRACLAALLLSLAPVSSAQSVTFTEYPISTLGNNPNYITAGGITEYATPTPNSGPYGITAGPDGAIWFVEYGANKIGRITMAGVITEFALPVVLYNSTQITAGPDGALWFTKSGPRLGRIT